MSVTPLISPRRGKTAVNPQVLDALLAGTIVEAAAAASLAALWAFVALYMLRLGLGDAPQAILGILAIALLPLLLTAAIVTTAFRSAGYRDVAMAGAIMVALVLPCFAIYLETVTLLALMVLATFSAFRIWRNCKGVLRTSTVRILLSSFMFGILLLASGAPSRIFLPEQMTLGIASSDSLFHTALAQMILRYRVASTGADGLNFQNYYFLSHAVAAGISKLTGASVPLVYVYWAGVSLKLHLIWALFLGSWLLEKKEGAPPSLQLLPRLGFAWLGVIAIHALESESFVFALAIFVMLIPSLGHLLRSSQVEARLRRIAVVVALAGAFLCASAKVSVGFFVAIALGAALWPLRRSRMLLVALVLGLGILAIVTARFLSPTDTLLLSGGWRILLLSYLPYLDWIAFVSFGLPVFMLLLTTWRPSFIVRSAPGKFDLTLRVHSLKNKSRDSIMRRIERWLFIDIPGEMQLLALMLVSCVIVLFTVPIGSNVAYFSLVLLISAFAVIPALLRSLYGIGFETGEIRKALTGAVAIVALVSVASFVWDAKNSVLQLYRSASPGVQAQDARELLYKSLLQSHSVAGGLRAELAALPWSRLTADIKEKAAFADGKLAVHTRASVEPFWRRLAAGTAWWCIAPHLMIPAEIGIPEIRNIAPKALESECVPDGIVFYGFGKRQDAHRTGKLPDVDLCRSARAFDIKSIYIIESITQLDRNYVLACEELPT